MFNKIENRNHLLLVKHPLAKTAFVNVEKKCKEIGQQIDELDLMPDGNAITKKKLLKLLEDVDENAIIQVGKLNSEVGYNCLRVENQGAAVILSPDLQKKDWTKKRQYH